MATLNIRQLPDGVHAQLRVRAAHNGRSMEAEARDILARACAAAPIDDDSDGYRASEGSSLAQDASATPVTVTLDAVVAEAARQQAARFGTTVEDWIRQLLNREFDPDPQCTELFRLMDEAGGNSHGATWTRDELYDRR